MDIPQIEWERTTPITYKQACALLGCKYTTLIAATERGVFTKLPVKGHEQKIIKEQVLLFVGKKQLKLAALSKEARRVWEAIDEKWTPAIEQKDIPSEPKTGYILNVDPNNLLQALIEKGILSNPPAQEDELESEVEVVEGVEEEKSFLNDVVLMAIMIGLLILVYVIAKSKPDIAKRAEETLNKIGLDENMLANQDEALELLRSHPEAVAELKELLESENLLSAA